MFVSVAAAWSLYEQNRGSFEKVVVNVDMIASLNVNTGRLTLVSGDTMWVGDDSMRMLEEIIRKEHGYETGW